MSLVTPIINPIKNGVKSAVKWAGTREIITKSHNPRYVNKDQFYINSVGVISIVIKDAYSCYFYVSQSLKNKDIPEKRRKYVAAYDLMNGITLFVVGLASFFATKKPVDRFASKLFDKYANREMIKSYEAYFKKSNQFEVLFKNNRISKTLQNSVDLCKSGFKTFVSLAIATIVAKRMFAPFIATPLATWAKEKMIKFGKKESPQNTFVKSSKVPTINFKNIQNTQLEKLYAKVKNSQLKSS